MITRIEALRFRCLRYVSQPLGRFHVIVGPNASGKTTFLDVVAFLGKLVADGLDEAIGERTRNFQDLLWGRSGDSFELAVELRIPEELRAKLANSDFDTVRYEVGIGFDPQKNLVVLREENVLLARSSPEIDRVDESALFPDPTQPPTTILRRGSAPDVRPVILHSGGTTSYELETPVGLVEGLPPLKISSRRSALGNLPEDESHFPATTWLKAQLEKGVQQLALNSLLIRKASPPGRGRGLHTDGANLPWVVAELEEKHAESLREWVEHLKTALPDLEDIRTIERPDDRHRYLMLRYRGGLEIPSWMTSDGTLRLLALTLPAYHKDATGIYLVEEPENGMHPRAVETLFQSLSSVYDAQVLMATHSSVVLGIVRPEDLLCFAKSEEGATDIVLGRDHPVLREWRQETNLSALFAAGVLG